MILCYVYRQEPSLTALLDATPISHWKEIQRPIAKHKLDLGEPCGRDGGRVEALEADRNSKGRLTESSNMDPSGSYSLNCYEI